jgi:hypothetical protein
MVRIKTIARRADIRDNSLVAPSTSPVVYLNFQRARKAMKIPIITPPAIPATPAYCIAEYPRRMHMVREMPSNPGVIFSTK